MACKQPIPGVTHDDVERIVYRDFPAEEFASVMTILNEYGTDKWHREPARVRLAALKVADGSMPRLRTCMELAKRDYRDALVAAEYPAYGKIRFQVRRLPEDEQRRIIDSDWQQYDSWLRR
jgi:hypothetical protein